jgi:hypothetical protein
MSLKDIRCQCGEEAGFKLGNTFSCPKCLAEVVSVVLCMRTLSGEKEPTIRISGKIAPEDFVESA